MRAAKRPTDVALLDLPMPRMSGLDLAERLRERSPETQVVILTGRSDVDSAVRGPQVGAFDFLFKKGLNSAAIEGGSGAARRRHAYSASRRTFSVSSAMLTGTA